MSKKKNKKNYKKTSKKKNKKKIYNNQTNIKRNKSNNIKKNNNNQNNLSNKNKNKKRNVNNKQEKTITNNSNIIKKENNSKINSSINNKYKNNTAMIIISSILFIIILFFTTLLIINNNLKLNLIGQKEQTIEVFSEYIDPGVNATIFKNNINNQVKITSNLDTNKLGTYKVNYTISFLSTKKITRTITVIDTQKPTITLNGKDTINIYVNDKYTDEGVTINDNYDKDLSNNLTVDNNLDVSKVGKYTITYTVHDSSNNMSSITRTINVKNKPIISTNTNNTYNISNPIEKYIKENNYDISIGYYNLTNNKTYYYKNTKLYYGASLIKTLDALYLYDNNLINDELKEYVKKAITISDNESHHILVERIGKNNLKQYGISIGAKNTLYGEDNFGYTSVNDQIAYMKKLYNLTKDNQQEELKSFFTNARKNYLLFENSPTIMHKYGHWEYVYNNVGIVLDENPYIVVILTNEGYDNYSNIISTLSKMIYEYHKNNN